MSGENSTKDVIIDTPKDTEEKSYDRNRKHRKGKGAQQRSNEKFRKKQNVKTQALIDDDIEQFKNSLRLNVEKAFGSRIPPNIIQPEIEVKPSTWALAEICEQVMIVLETAGKIRFPNPDERASALTALQVISAAQLEAKLFFSRMGSLKRVSWEYNPEYHQLMEYYISAFPRAFAPIAAYIDQFGSFTHEGQKYVPWAPEDDDEYKNNFCTVRSFKMQHGEDSVGRRHVGFLNTVVAMHHPPPNGIPVQGHFGPNGRPIYCVVQDRAALEQLDGAVVDGNINPAVIGQIMPNILDYVEAEIVLDNPSINFEQCVRDFTLLQHMVARKFKTWPELNLKDGKGTTAQLVASEDGNHKFRKAWSPRKIGSDMLALGALFQIAPDRIDRKYPIYSQDVASVEAYIQVDRGIASFVDTMHGDMISFS